MFSDSLNVDPAVTAGIKNSAMLIPFLGAPLALGALAGIVIGGLGLGAAATAADSIVFFKYRGFHAGLHTIKSKTEAANTTPDNNNIVLHHNRKRIFSTTFKKTSCLSTEKKPFPPGNIKNFWCNLVKSGKKSATNQEDSGR